MTPSRQRAERVALPGARRPNRHVEISENPEDSPVEKTDRRFFLRVGVRRAAQLQELFCVFTALHHRGKTFPREKLCPGQSRRRA